MLTRNRIFGALLLISWTLNVALGVALYYSNDHPPFPRPPFAPRAEGMTPGTPGIPDEFRETLRRGVEPLMDEQHCIARDLYAALIADSLDTTRLRVLSDSLSLMRGQIQKTMISRASEYHGQLSLAERERIYSRMIGRMDHPRHARKSHHPDRD